MQDIEKAKREFVKRHNYPALRIKAVLFDMDGVLYDSMPFHAKAWTEALKAEGVTFTEEDVYMNEGSRGSDTVQTAFMRERGTTCTKEEEQRIYDVKSRIYQSLGQVPMMDGAKDVTETLIRLGVERTVVTGSGEWTTIERLQKDFPGAFDKEKIVTAYDVKLGKPHPEPYLKGLEKMGVKPWEAMVVENAPMGVEAGVAAGVFTVAVNTGVLKDEVLKEAGADLVFVGMAELGMVMEEVVRD